MKKRKKKSEKCNMNEQERLQRIVDILADNAHDICYVETTDKDAIVDADMDGVQTVAREICNVFKPIPKETRSKREQLLDVQFERMGVKPRIFHIISTDLDMFNAVTIAQPKIGTKYPSYSHHYLFRYICDNITKYMYSPATATLNMLKALGVYGVAICDKSDQFNKRTGRMKAKGRLMQHLLKAQQK